LSNAYDDMMHDIMVTAELHKHYGPQLVRGQRDEDPGMDYFFYYDQSTERPVSPFFHSKENAIIWWTKHYA
jgi:hypothetical protein